MLHTTNTANLAFSCLVCVSLIKRCQIFKKIKSADSTFAIIEQTFVIFTNMKKKNTHLVFNSTLVTEMGTYAKLGLVKTVLKVIYSCIKEESDFLVQCLSAPWGWIGYSEGVAKANPAIDRHASFMGRKLSLFTLANPPLQTRDSGERAERILGQGLLFQRTPF